MILLFNSKGISQNNSSRLSGFKMPVAGSTLKLVYNPKGGPLQEKDNINVVAYLFNDYKWEIKNVKFVNNNGKWINNFCVPDNCGFIAFKFVNIDKDGNIIVDNNDDSGFVNTVRVNKKVAPGAKLAWGVFRMPSFEKSIHGYFNKFTISKDALEFWLKQEIKEYPQNLPKFFDIYIAVAKFCTGDKFKNIAPKLIEQFIANNKNISEGLYSDIMNIYRFDLKDTSKANEIKSLIQEKFPNGQNSRFEAFSNAYSNSKGDRVKKMDNFLKNFPLEEWRKDSDAENQKYMYDRIFLELAKGYFVHDDTDKLIKLLPRLDFNVLVDIYHWTIARAFRLKLKPLPMIYNLSKEIIGNMRSKMNDGSYKNAFASMPWQLETHPQKMMDEKLAMHIEILNAIGKYKEAPNYFAQISAERRYISTRVNEAYVNILKHIGTKKELVNLLEKSVRSNSTTPEMLKILKELYLENNDSKGFNKYLNTLKDTEEHKLFVQKIKNEIVKISYKPFRLSGSHGLKVDSKKFKNKIVVIDFWANWCGPCKRAFKGMQLAVNKYSSDKDVEFYFISTLGDKKHYKKSSKTYLKEKGYSFNLLFDEENARNGKINKVFSTFSEIFKSSGIPRKVIVKDGYIRYTSEGYSGSPTKLLDEISVVIDLLKSEK